MNETSWHDHVKHYEECGHKRKDEIAVDCIHCHVAWCHERIKVLEERINKKGE